MIAFICNHCKKPIDMDKKHCVHIKISYGERAIVNKGQYADGWDADLCEECWNKLCPMIDEYYYGGNKYLNDNLTEKDGELDTKHAESTADAEKKKHGEWLSNAQTDEYICSLCSGIVPVDSEKENFYESNYCPNCGAKMDGKKIKEKFNMACTNNTQPRVVFDFDGVIHSYKSGWQGVAVIPDEPVEGIKEAIEEIRTKYLVAVVSTRCADEEGMKAVCDYLKKHDITVDEILDKKPPAVVYIDDRAICFDGNSKTLLDKIKTFKPWHVNL